MSTTKKPTELHSEENPLFFTELMLYKGFAQLECLSSQQLTPFVRCYSQMLRRDSVHLLSGQRRKCGAKGILIGKSLSSEVP